MRNPFRRDDEPTPERLAALLDERIEVLAAIVAALDRWADVSAILSSRTLDDAREGLRELLGTTDLGANVVLDMQLRRVTHDEQSKARQRLAELRDERASLLDPRP